MKIKKNLYKSKKWEFDRRFINNSYKKFKSISGFDKKFIKINKKEYKVGLDQYIFKEIENEYDDDGRSKVEEIHYWRKNYELNDWACWNFCPDGIADFNCERLPLYDFMIDNLIEHIIYNLNLPSVDKDGYGGIISDDVLKSFMDCKKRINDGEILYYYAWW